MRLKCRKYYKYIFWLLLDLVITNSYILWKHFTAISRQFWKSLGLLLQTNWFQTTAADKGLDNQQFVRQWKSSVKPISSLKFQASTISVTTATNTKKNSIVIPFSIAMITNSTCATQEKKYRPQLEEN